MSSVNRVGPYLRDFANRNGRGLTSIPPSNRRASVIANAGMKSYLENQLEGLRKELVSSNDNKVKTQILEKIKYYE